MSWHVETPIVGTSTETSGRETSLPTPQTSHEGKLPVGAENGAVEGAATKGAGVTTGCATGADVNGGFVLGAQTHVSLMNSTTKGQSLASMKPL